MSVDYNLVVIGSSPEGIYAAKMANSLQARVALVTQCDEYYIPNYSDIFCQSLGQIRKFVNQIENNCWGIDPESVDLNQINLQDVNLWQQLITERLQAENSLERLAVEGVDIIVGKGEFCRLPNQAFIVGKRKLRSQKYLIATGAKSVIHPKYNLDQVNCLTIDDFWQNNSLVNLPNKIAIIGNSAKSLALAQGLTNLNKKINLVIPETRILPQEDSDLARLIQAQLTADGIEIFTHANIIKIFQNQNNKIIQLGDRIIETESIIFTDDYKANISGLNLQGVGIDFRDSEIIVDHKFQTTNKDIYACGNVIGDIKSSVIVSQEVNIAIKNMLFISWFNKSRFNDNCLPKVIFTQPNIARLGINKTEAIRLYGKNIYVIKEYFKTISQAQISGNTTGWCEMIFRPNGQIIGCTIIGDRANELISTIAVMMQYKIKLNRNPQSQLLQVKISSISPSFAEILQRVATSFYLQKLQRDRRLIRRLEDWFSFRRNWNL